MNNFLKKLRRKWTYSIIGLWIAFKEEKSLWVFILLFPIIITLGVIFKISYIEWSIVMIIIFINISIEVINTALEAAVDAISYQYNVKVKKIKDIAAGATLSMSTGSMVGILLIFIPKIMERI